MKLKNKGIKYLIIVLILVLMVPVQAFAAGPISTDKEGSLTLNIAKDDMLFQEMSIKVYRIATVDKYDRYELTELFKTYEEMIDFSDLGGENGNKTASTLEILVKADKIDADQEALTNSEGEVTFNNLKLGMYLVIPERKVLESEEGITELKAKPFLISVPSLNSSDEWLYDIVATPKCEVNDIIQYMDLTVIKSWDDDGLEKERPESISVDIMKDGKVFKTISLSDKNGWKYEVKKLDARCDWSAIEKNVKGYKVTYENYDNYITITNTIIPSENPPTDNDGDNHRKKIPQTGLLWYPVIVMAIAGTLFLLIGRRKARTHE